MASAVVPATAATLSAGVLAGDRRALARAISVVENRADGYRDLLTGLHAKVGRAFRIGITGPPGAGKSTLVDALAAQWADRGDRVGIVAVDPTSPFTGGALLGDRVRMGDLADRPEVYVRSMATRGSTGGIAAATRDICSVLDAYGFDWLLIETVGVGQIEIEVMHICDAVVVVFVPESGDGVQALKAGLIEIAHVFVVNKADRPGADQLATELSLVVAHRTETDDWRPPVLTTEATRRRGIDTLEQEIVRCREHLVDTGGLHTARRRQARVELENLLKERLHRYLSGHVRLDAWIDDLTERMARGDLDPHRGADMIWQRLRAESDVGTTRE